mgnify:FL=1
MSQVKLFGGKSRRAAPQSSAPRERTKKQRSPLKLITVILTILAVLECGYFVCVYSDIPFIAKWREIYIQTAMDTMSHQWLAKAFIPQGVIEEAMASRAAAMQEQTEHSSSDNWANQQPSDTDTEPSTPENTVTEDPEKTAFYELFWEIDPNSMDAYLKQHPEALENGWDEIYINEAGLDDEGTSIQTTMGEQVLAIDVPNQILLVRVKGSGYRGVLAVAKDPGRLCVENSAGLGSYGQYVGTIAENHNGVLAMNGSGFLDPGGVGNGGLLTGYSMSNGEAYQGAPFGWSYKRIELREDNYFYIVDTSASVHEDTTDAVEFTPAVIVDGKVLDTSGWSGLHPRTIIGQSDKGEILMLVVEGRLVQSVGISVADCAPILLDHGCMQALNLDGGTSAILWYDGEYVTQCSNTALPEGRLLPNAFVYKAQ